QLATCASRRWFLPSQNQTSICCLGPVGPSQKIEFVFSASPETIRREPRECDLLRSVGQLRDLAVCAPCNPVIFFSHRGWLTRRRSVAFCRHELAFPAIHGQQIRDHLPRYG